MTTLQFADTHNLVAFLSKPAESEGFEQTVDFLNVNPIRYALTINPTIYTSCTEQFWAIVKAKTINGEVQLQALVDGKKIIITESILTFYKAFFSPQWKFLTHTILQCLSAKTTAWNKFSSTMASAIICLATNQKFNFSKYIFESMVKNLENVSGKFLMYLRFVQVFLEKQLEGMSNHKRIYVTPSHTKKIFGNMRRVGKGFSGRERPPFSINVCDSSRRMRVKVPQPSGPTDNVADEAVNKEMDDSLERAATTATSLDAEQDRGNTNKTQYKATPNEPSSLGTSSGGGPRVIDMDKTKTSQAQEITSSKLRVKKLDKKGGLRTHKLKRLYKETYLVSTLFDADTNMCGVHDLVGDEVVFESEVTIKVASIIPVSAATTTTTIINDDEITLAKALAELKSAKLPTTTAATTITAVAQDPKNKGIVILEPVQKPTPTVSSYNNHHTCSDLE
ncbi:hypothetical protein Tco_0897277 [Tanacetum coccineum]